MTSILAELRTSAAERVDPPINRRICSHSMHRARDIRPKSFPKNTQSLVSYDTRLFLLQVVVEGRLPEPG